MDFSSLVAGTTGAAAAGFAAAFGAAGFAATGMNLAGGAFAGSTEVLDFSVDTTLGRVHTIKTIRL
jgi:hypothetical protein